LIITGKLFEYLAARRPVLFIGPEKGDAAEIIRDSQAGTIISFNDNERLMNGLLRYYHDFKNGELQLPSCDISHLSRRSLTVVLSDMMDKLIEKKR
jgi:hypothetical protein